MFSIYATIFLVAYSSSVIEHALGNNIEHVIVLMLENRAFDHMLGFMKAQNADIEGCLTGMDGCDNPIDPLDMTSEKVSVTNTAVYQQTSPGHSISSTTSQIYGSSNTSADMNGFIASYTSKTDGENEKGSAIMKCFSEEHIPAITSLAKEFAMFDGWFSSVPGPTEVNRAYAASATSNGMGTNDAEKMVKGFPQKTMFKQIEEMGLDSGCISSWCPLC